MLVDERVYNEQPFKVVQSRLNTDAKTKAHTLLRLIRISLQTPQKDNLNIGKNYTS